MSIRRVSRACLTYKRSRPDEPADRSPGRQPAAPRDTTCTSVCGEGEAFRPAIVSFCSLQPRGGDEGQGNGRRYGRTIEINLDDRRGVDEGVWRVSQRGRGETRSGWKAIGPKPNETRSGWKDGDFEPLDPLECLSAEMFLDHLLDEDSLAFLDILAEVTHAGGKATPDGEEGPGRGADELSVSFSLKTDCAVRGDSDADSDPGGAAEEDILDRWEEWILFVAVDVVSGLQMVIPARYVRLAAIPWHVLLPGDPLCLPKDYVVLGRKRVLTSAARGSDSLSSTLSESRRLAKVTAKRPRGRPRRGPENRPRSCSRGSRGRGRSHPRCRPPRPPERERGPEHGLPLPLHLLEDSSDQRARRAAQWILSEFQGDGFLAALNVETKCIRCDTVLPSVDEAARHYQSAHIDRRNCPFCCAVISRDAMFCHLKRHYVGLVLK